MKLVIAGRYPLEPTKIKGGTEAYIYNLVEGLQKLQVPNWDIHIVRCSKEIKKSKTVNNNHVTIHFLPSTKEKRFGNITLNIIDRYRIQKKINELKPEIIHAHGTDSYAVAALEMEYPTLLTVHGILFKEADLRKGLLNKIRKIPVIYLERICLKKATDILCDAPYVKNAIIKFTNAKINIVEPPISEKYFNIKNEEVANRILFVGHIERRKRLLDLVKAINIVRKQIPEIELHIVGNTDERDYLDIIKQYIKVNKLEESIYFLGRITEEQLYKEYGKCCLLVLPSAEESAGMVMQQAMAVGKAVVATRVGGIPYFVNDSTTGFLIDCGDVEGLAEKIKLLLSNNDMRSKFGENAKQEALERFKAEIIARKTYEVYQEVLKKGRYNL